MLPVAPFANSSRIIAESSAGSYGTPSGRGPRCRSHENTAVTATTSPNSQVAMYDQCDARSPETPAPASPRSNLQM